MAGSRPRGASSGPRANAPECEARLRHSRLFSVSPFPLRSLTRPASDRHGQPGVSVGRRADTAPQAGRYEAGGGCAQSRYTNAMVIGEPTAEVARPIGHGTMPSNPNRPGWRPETAGQPAGAAWSFAARKPAGWALGCQGHSVNPGRLRPGRGCGVLVGGRSMRGHVRQVAARMAAAHRGLWPGLAGLPVEDAVRRPERALSMLGVSGLPADPLPIPTRSTCITVNPQIP